MNSINENIPPAPPLSPHLAAIYSRLPEEAKRLFNKAFLMMWQYLLPKRSFLSSGAVLRSYWAIDQLRIKAGLNSSELSMLQFIYEISERGNKIIHSKHIYNGMVVSHLQTEDCKRTILCELKRLGYIIRLTRDPSAPYLQRSISRQPVFIQMTTKGVGVIQDIEKDLYKILFNTSFNEIIGVNK